MECFAVGLFGLALLGIPALWAVWSGARLAPVLAARLGALTGIPGAQTALLSARACGAIGTGAALAALLPVGIAGVGAFALEDAWARLGAAVTSLGCLVGTGGAALACRDLHTALRFEPDRIVRQLSRLAVGTLGGAALFIGSAFALSPLGLRAEDRFLSVIGAAFAVAPLLVAGTLSALVLAMSRETLTAIGAALAPQWPPPPV